MTTLIFERPRSVSGLKHLTYLSASHPSGIKGLWKDFAYIVLETHCIRMSTNEAFPLISDDLAHKLTQVCVRQWH